MATVTKIDSPRFQLELDEEEALLVYEAMLSIDGVGVEDRIIDAFHEADVMLYESEFRLEGLLTHAEPRRNVSNANRS